MSNSTWRLIRDDAHSGAWNMARDESLLLCASESSLPVLRFYNWSSPCVSLGRLQKNSAFITENSLFDSVRRPTGGRAVLHQHEITYCAVVHQSLLPRESRSVIGAYNWLSKGFIAGLETLGLQAQLAPARNGIAAWSTPGRSTPGAANCFQSSAQSDFLIDGRKLIGAAQCRKNDVILQHGSLLLNVEEKAWRESIGGEMENAVSLRALGVDAPCEGIIAALCAGMERAWQVSFLSSEFSIEETKMASRLHAEKYSSASWNARGEDESGFLART